MGQPKTKTAAEHPHFEALPSLFRIATAMGSTLDLDPLLKLILRLTMRELHAQRGSILLFDKDSDQLKMLAARGMPRKVVEKGYIPRKGSIAEWVIEHDKPILLGDVSHDSRFTSIARERSLHSSMCVPLRAKGSVIGTINISRTRREPFTEEDLDILVVLATHAAVSIENARLYEENLKAERLATVGRTVAGISHCTKNMLTGLKGGSKIIELGCKQRDWALIEQGYDISKRSTDRIELLVLDMLDYSKERTPTRAAIDLPRLVSEVFASLAHAAQESQVKLLSRLSAACACLYADSNQLYRALLNLVTNAIDAIRESPNEGGEVEIVAERVEGDSPVVRRCLREAAGEFDLIHVRDTGVGIPPEHMPNLFHPFFSSKGSKGTGLGLAVTRKIAREHGGDVLIESQVGRGTIFTLVLPVVAPPPPEEPSANLEPPPEDDAR